MVEIFKTNVQTKVQAEIILELLLKTFPRYQINFDLEDVDRILRVEAAVIYLPGIMALLTEGGYQYELLE